MMPYVREIQTLSDSKVLIEAGWCTQAYARDEDGQATNYLRSQGMGSGGGERYYPSTKPPVCYCLAGAVEHSLENLGVPPAQRQNVWQALVAAIRRWNGRTHSVYAPYNVVGFNDATNKTAVLEVLDLALQFLDGGMTWQDTTPTRLPDTSQ